MSATSEVTSAEVSTAATSAGTAHVRELGHVVLYVRDVARSVEFYEGVLGFHRLRSGAPIARAEGFSGGRTHHELLLIEVGEDATPIPEGRRVGMYHFGLKVGDTDDELREVLARVKARPDLCEHVGQSDHYVTHSLYVLDPDGNEVELYIDTDVDWQNDPNAFAAPIKPLVL